MTADAPVGALLYVLSDPPEGGEERFDAWYDDDHITRRLGVPGFLNARRYRAAAGPHRFLACYDLTGAGVLATDDYLAVRDHPTDEERAVVAVVPYLARRVYRPLGAVPVPDPTEGDPPVMTAIELEGDADGDAGSLGTWASSLLAGEVTRVRWFELTEGAGPRFLVLADGGLPAGQETGFPPGLTAPAGGAVSRFGIYRTFPVPAWGRP
jgi:hypothetical protein